MKPQKCHCCNGSGIELNSKVMGRMLKGRRIGLGILQSTIAARMRVTAQYVGRLEKGKSKWSQALVTAYRKALKD